MATTNPPKYRKLPGHGRRGGAIAVAVVTSSSLWLGPDHLLLVDNSRFSEEYKRFYFRDIKAIIVRRTTRWGTLSRIMGGIVGLALLFGFLTFRLADGKPFAVFAASIAGLFTILLIINWALGPTCICHLRTAVQQEELPSLKRIRTARKLIGIVRPLIENVQGALSEEGIDQVAELIANYENLPVDAIKAQRAFPPRGTSVALPPPLAVMKPATNLKWRVALIAAVLTNAGASAYTWASQGKLALILLWLTILALGGVVIAWFARMPRGASKTAAWFRLGIWAVWMLVMFGYWYVAQMTYVFKNPGRMDGSVMWFTALHNSLYSVVLGATVPLGIWASVELIALFMEMRGPRADLSASTPATVEATADR